ncbi:MAG: polysaccharide deacetylase [Ruminococcaceae bacterium]|nr:polysaccharide deacetylase [Oscillospiraceae bacterium]
MKILTFSYDDGTTQDIRLAALFHKYGMKATFNVNSGLLGTERELVRCGVTVRHDKIRPADVKHVYDGHEVASHTLTHPDLTKKSDEEIIEQVEKDRLTLSELCGYEVVGFAYPGGGVNYSDHVADVIRANTGVRYARTTLPTLNFEKQENLFEFKPTVHHFPDWDQLFALGEHFLSLPAEADALFYVWGHGFEFDIANDWNRFEEFLQMMANKKEICYMTNKEALLRAEG